MVGAAFVAGLSTPSGAAVEETFFFTGVCTDCSGDVGATLVLENYTQGKQLAKGDFISFSYSGSNLVPAFTISPSELFAISGVIPMDLPAPAQFSLEFTTLYSNFLSQPDGTWYVDHDDYGTNGVWSVPEPSTWAMMALGFAGLGFVGHRSRKRTAARTA